MAQVARLPSPDSRPAAEPRGRGVGPRRDDARARARSAPSARSSTPATSTARATRPSTAPALALYAKGEPVDAITLVDELEQRGELDGVGGRVRIHELAALVPATANAAHYARIVREMATLRGLIRVGAEIVRHGARARRRHARPRRARGAARLRARRRLDERQPRALQGHADGGVRPHQRALHDGADVTGVPTGFRDLDGITAGFQPGQPGRRSPRAPRWARARSASRSPRTSPSASSSRARSSASRCRGRRSPQRLMCMEGKVDSHKHPHRASSARRTGRGSRRRARRSSRSRSTSTTRRR